MNDIEVLDTKKEKANNKPKGKIVLTLILVIILLAAAYLIILKNNSSKNLENKLEKSSIDYFEKYMSTNDSTSTYIVTLDMLKNANKQGENYDLNGLEKCKTQSTLSRITINYNDGKPKKVEVELNC